MEQIDLCTFMKHSIWGFLLVKMEQLVVKDLTTNKMLGICMKLVSIHYSSYAPNTRYMYMYIVYVIKV